MTIFHTTTKSILLGIALIAFLPTASAQPDNAKIDSLKLVLRNATEDTTKMNALKDLIDANFNSNPEISKSYAFQHLQMAENASDFYREIDSYLILSSIYYRKGNPDSMRILAQKALDYLSHSENKKFLYLEMKAYSRLGIAAYTEGGYETALQYFEEAGSRMTMESDILGNQMNIGIIKTELGDYEGGLEAYSKFKDLAIRIKNKRFEAIALDGIGSIYADLKESEKALFFYQKALKLKKEIGDEHGTLEVLERIAVQYEISDIEKALALYESLLEKSENVENERHIIAALIALMRMNKDIGNFEEALKYSEKSYQILKNFPDGHKYKNAQYYHSAEIFNLKGEYLRALKRSRLAMEGFNISGEKGDYEFITALQIHLESLLFTGNTTEAWETLLLRDSLLEVRNRETRQEATAAAEVKLRLREKELEFERAEQESELQVAKAEGRQNLLLSLLGGVLLALVLGVYFYRRVQSAKKKVEAQKALVDQSLVEKEVLLKEIHHRVKNNLQIISSLLDEQARTSSDEQLKKMMREGQDRVQSMALIHQNLYQSDNLAGIEIKAYINELTKNITHSQAGGKDIAIELNVNDAKLDIDTAIPIGLILNELITNCYKYAFAGKETGVIAITFQEIGDKKYDVHVKDNGTGLPADFDSRKAKSLGMNLVEGLVRQLDGAMKFSSTEGGTEFQLQF